MTGSSPAPARTPTGRADSLDPLFSPSSIAVVGASQNPRSVGSLAVASLRRHFAGKLYLVNGKHAVVGGTRAYPSIADLPEAVDLAIIAVPVSAAIEVVEQCAAKGVRSALIFTAGFAEADAEGAEAQRRIKEIAAAAGMRLCGPNAIGFMNVALGALATFFITPDDVDPVSGPIGLVSQSGGFGTYVDSAARDAGLDVGWFISTGNEVDVHLAEALAYLVDRPEVQVLLAFSEAIRDGELFVQVATRAAELGKPFVILKVGGSEAGERAVLSHTASISGSDSVFDAVCQQYGVLRASSLQEMLDWAAVLQTGRRFEGRRMGLLTGSGGGGILLADSCSAQGFDVPELPPVDTAAIEPLIPAYGSARNPVDVTAQAIASGAANYAAVLRTMVDSKSLDAVVTLSGMRGPVALEVAGAIADVYRSTNKPMAITWMSPHKGATELLRDAGVPLFSDANRAVAAMAALRRHGEARIRRPAERGPVDAARRSACADILRRADGKPFLLESDTKELLGHYGLPVTWERVVTTADEAASAAESHGGRVALKALSYDLPHKSDVGGVRLDIKTPQEARDAFHALGSDLERNAPLAHLEGVLVQEMVPSGTELMCGLHRDPVFGPIVTVGIGGTLVEIVSHVVLRRAPFDFDEAVAALTAIADGRLVSSSRGLTSAQVALVAGVLVSLSELSMEIDGIAELDINPLIVSARGVYVTDALVKLSAA